MGFVDIKLFSYCGAFAVRVHASLGLIGESIWLWKHPTITIAMTTSMENLCESQQDSRQSDMWLVQKKKAQKKPS